MGSISHLAGDSWGQVLSSLNVKHLWHSWGGIPGLQCTYAMLVSSDGFVFWLTYLNLADLGVSACTGGEEGRPGAWEQTPWRQGRRGSKGGVHQTRAETRDSGDQSREGFESCPENSKKTQKHVLQNCLAGWHHFWVLCGCKYFGDLFLLLLFSLSFLLPLKNHHKHDLIVA